MNTRFQPDLPGAVALERYGRVRRLMPELAGHLSAEDLAAQSMADASPGKWHLAHSSWFFEAMILSSQPGYEPVDRRFQPLFNSYYEALGERVARAERGLMTRPSLDSVLAYRREIDRRMALWLQAETFTHRDLYLFELGLQHEQQHAELFLMDLLHLMSRSPLKPSAYETEPRSAPLETAKGGWVSFEGGLVDLGSDLEGFSFDNERPSHPVWLQPFSLCADLVTNGDWLVFMEDGGYQRPDLWLSDGWAAAKSAGWQSPEYWTLTDEGWSAMSLTGVKPIVLEHPVRHISFYEADAFARWSGRRLPTEAEWEHAARTSCADFSNLAGEVWQWTASAYAPYPGFAPTPGTAAEYNGKFMANQMVLRGGAFATPAGHARISYRNFFYPAQRWAFMGLRLAAGPGVRTEAADEQGQDQTAGFQADLVCGLSSDPKSVPPKWFYDAEGSHLFEAITALRAYYPTRQETALIRDRVALLVGDFGPDAVIVEFGSGASEKTRILLDASSELGAYVPIDISETALNAAACRIGAAYPGLQVRPVLGDFENLTPLPEDLPPGRRIGFFPGSTIGNLTEAKAIAFLRSAREQLGAGALFILGVDLVKDPATLVAAYDDPEGITARFNLNLLQRANVELGTDFDISSFSHRAVWNQAESRMEMHLVAQRPMTVHLKGQGFSFLAGETLHTESSRKYTRASVEALAQASGWCLRRFEVSDEPSVALAVLEG